MKNIAKDPNARERVEFNDVGEPIGPGSVKLSSYLGVLVREHVPVTVEEWRKISEELKTVLWKSIQARFVVDEEYQKIHVMRQMGCLWRASKSRLVTQIRYKATTNQERMNLRPKNVTPSEWRKFVKLKTSSAFAAVSESYKERRKRQIPHTCSRRGMVRLADDLKQESSDPSQVTRLDVWVKSRTKKDGTPVNTKAAEKFRKVAELVDSADISNSTNPEEDHLAQLLGPENPGRLRAMGRSMSKTKLACFQMKNKCMVDMEEKQQRLLNKVHELEDELARIKGQRQEPEVGENSAAARARSVNRQAHRHCVLLDCFESDDKVAEGHIISSDPEDFVNDIPLGPHAVKVFIEMAIILDACLWRPTPGTSTIEQTVGEMIAWPVERCIVSDEGLFYEDISLKSPTTDCLNKCKLLDWSGNGEVVAEGRWQSQEPETLVNGIPLGPKAVKIFVDVVHGEHTFLWRPTPLVRYLGDAIKSFVAWPASKCVFENTEDFTPTKDPLHTPTRKSVSSKPPTRKSVSPCSASNGPKSASPRSKAGKRKAPASSLTQKAPAASPTQKDPTSSPTKKAPESSATYKAPPSSPKLSRKKNSQVTQSPIRRSQRTGQSSVPKENQKCKLMAISGKNEVVAEGRWASDNPEQTVHFVPLGPNAVKVWVDIVKVSTASVWKPSSEIECMGDAIGSAIAWPKDKVKIC